MDNMLAVAAAFALAVGILGVFNAFAASLWPNKPSYAEKILGLVFPDEGEGGRVE